MPLKLKRFKAREGEPARSARVARSWRTLIPGEPKIRAVVAMFVVGAGIVAGSIIGPFHSSDRGGPTTTTPRPLTVKRTFQWGRVDNPDEVAAAPDGAAWIADEHRALIYRLSEDGSYRKYPLRGIEDPQDAITAVVSGIASDRSGNAWVLASVPLSDDQYLIGMTPSGAEVARYRVPKAVTFALDRDSYAWLTYDLGDEGGVAITSVALRSGAMKSYTAFPGVEVWAHAKPDPRGGVLLVGQLRERASTVVAARVTRKGVAARRVDWPRSLISPFVPDFAVDRDGGIWLGTNHGLARIDGGGMVTSYPLFRTGSVSSLETEPDGHIVFSVMVGSQIALPKSFEGLRSTTYIGELDPEHPTRLPTLQLAPDGHDVGEWFGVTRRHAAVLPDAASHRVFLMPLTVPRPTSPPSPDFSATVKRIIDQHQAAMTKLLHGWSRHFEDDGRPFARAAARTITKTRARLLAASAQSGIVPDPLIARLIARTAADGRSAIGHLSSMARFPRKPTQGSRYFNQFLIAYVTVTEQVGADLYEVAEAFGLPPTDWRGHTAWKTEQP